jgi:hypothetical protein
MKVDFDKRNIENKFGTNYNHSSDKICSIESLGVQQTKWNNIFHDQRGNEQKLYCHLVSGEDVLLKCEYSEDTALIAVHKPQHYKAIGERVPKLIEPVLAAIQTVYPQAAVVGEEQFIRVVF